MWHFFCKRPHLQIISLQHNTCVGHEIPTVLCSRSLDNFGNVSHCFESQKFTTDVQMNVNVKPFDLMPVVSKCAA